jgi:fucose permease
MIAVVPRLVHSHLIPSAIGLLIGISLIGGALFPWLVGALAQYTGLWVLLPVLHVLTILMCANWWAITRWALHPFR